MTHALLTTRSSALARSQSFMNKPIVAHLKDTMSRFGARLGNQFAAAITYFLVLALIPTLMFAFAALGFTLDVIKPEWVDVVKGWITQTVPGQDQLVDMLQNFLDNWQAVGIIGVLSALYTAQGFIGNFKDAVRSQLTDNMDDIPKEAFVPRIINNVITLIGLLIMILLAVGATVIGTGLQTTIARWLDLPGWFSPVLNIGTIVLSLFMNWLMFMFIFSMIPDKPIPMRTRGVGSLAGAVALTLLLNIATILIDLFSGSPTAALFGPVIAVMLSMNIFIRIVLMVAAWMGTSHDSSPFAVVPKGRPRPSELRHKEINATDSLAALLAAVGLIILTLLGLKKYEQIKS